MGIPTGSAYPKLSHGLHIDNPLVHILVQAY